MTDQSPLLVPMMVEALVVNSQNRPGGPFLRMRMDYGVLNEMASAEPTPLSLNADTQFTDATSEGGQSLDPYYDGVYLKWRMPDAFRHGRQDATAGDTAYPLVPNRWVVVRYSGADPSAGASAAWLVESDYQAGGNPPEPANYAGQSSLYLQREDKLGVWPLGTFIGRNVAAGTAWSETSPAMSLTAMGPGNPGFAVYQPDNNNVFSFVDLLDGQPDQSLTYLVFGWLSDPSQDPLAGVTDADQFAAALKALGWTLAERTDTSLTADWTLCCGVATGVQWQDEATPPSAMPDTGDIGLAIGATSVEALTALVSSQPDADDFEPELFEAFQYDLLSVFDETDFAPKLANAMLDRGFNALHGGYGWTIVTVPGAAAPPDADELAKEAAWLDALNAAQTELDEALATLQGLREQLYVMWWKHTGWDTFAQGQEQPQQGLTRHALSQQLDPQVTRSLAAQTAWQMQTVQALMAQVPTGADEAELAQAIAAYAAAQALPSTRQLKRFAQPRLAQPNEPVVLLSNAGAGDIAGMGADAVCRFPSQLVTGFTYQGQAVTASTAGLSIPVPDTSAWTGAPWTASLMTALVQEAFFLDPGNAAQVAEQAFGTTDAATVQAIATAMADAPIGTPPVGGATAWTANPWRPLWLLWQADYYPIPWQAEGATANWSFDGQAYAFTGAVPSNPTSMSLQGRILLTPNAAVTMQNRVLDFLAQSPGATGDQQQALLDLLGFVQDTDQWDLLSQALDGFNEQLTLRQAGVFLNADCSVLETTPSQPELLGAAVGRPPLVGTIPSTPGGSTDFQALRAGQFVFTWLQIVDEWGQSVQPVTPGVGGQGGNYDDIAIARAPEMVPTQALLPNLQDQLVQLSPTLLQPARLSFAAAPPAGVSSPVLGWVLHNALDASLMVFDAAGASLGELAGGLADGATEAPTWLATPGSAYPTLQDVGAVPGLGPFVTAVAGQDMATFTAFLAAIDEALWTSLPASATGGGELAMMAGRPLALVSAQLELQLSGPALTDPSWQYTFDPPTAAVTGYAFDVQLGDVDWLDDGLVGYGVGGDWSAFNIVAQSGATAGGWLQPTGGAAGNFLSLTPSESVAVTLLMDPRGSVHAFSGLLPTAALALPPAETASALKAISPSFRYGPILPDSTIQADGAARLRLPLPAARRGWAWGENEEGDWTGYRTANADPSAALSDVGPVLRTGRLQTTIPLAVDS